MKAARDTWVNPVAALALCAAGGALFAWLRTPLPWMIGPLLAMAACNFSGARLRSAPGGIAEMCITAKVLQLGVPLVTAAHVTRVLILINAIAPLYRLARHLARH